MIHRKLSNDTHERSPCPLTALSSQETNLDVTLINGIEHLESLIKDDWTIALRRPQWEPNHAALEGEAINLFTIGLRPLFQHVLILLGIRTQHDLTVRGDPLIYLKLGIQELLEPPQV